MQPILKILKNFTRRLEFRSLRAQRRWHAVRDFVLLILNNADRDRRPLPRRTDGRE